MVQISTPPRASAAPRRGIGARDLSLVAVFAALIAALTLVPAVPVGALGVPITLQTLGVAIAATVLGGLRGGAAVGLYVVVGLAGIPVFSKFSGGVGILAGPSAGYLLAFPITALIVGALATLVLRRAGRRRYVLLFLAGMAGSILCTHPLGIVGMSVNAQIPLAQAALYDLAYWPGDIVKNLIAAAVATTVFKAFPRLARRDFNG